MGRVHASTYFPEGHVFRCSVSRSGPKVEHMTIEVEQLTSEVGASTSEPEKSTLVPSTFRAPPGSGPKHRVGISDVQ
eukprot:15450423-Alexandrium_andersonii.AAC.1